MRGEILPLQRESTSVCSFSQAVKEGGTLSQAETVSLTQAGNVISRKAIAMFVLFTFCKVLSYCMF